jgi:hypothetical protein
MSTIISTIYNLLDVESKTITEIKSSFLKHLYIYIILCLANLIKGLQLFLQKVYPDIFFQCAFVILYILFMISIVRFIRNETSNLKLLLFCKMLTGILSRLHVGQLLYTTSFSFNILWFIFQIISLAILMRTMYVLVRLRWKVMNEIEQANKSDSENTSV